MNINLTPPIEINSPWTVITAIILEIGFVIGVIYLIINISYR